MLNRLFILAYFLPLPRLRIANNRNNNMSFLCRRPPLPRSCSRMTYRPTKTKPLCSTIPLTIMQMETNMQYKTITLELLLQYPEIHEPLRKKRMLLPALESYASDLKTSHETWKERLAETKPGSDPSQLASEALELALADMETRLRSESAPRESEALSLDDAMTYIRQHTPAD